MERTEAHTIPLKSGRTSKQVLPGMTEGKFYSIGYNSTYGLIDVCEDNGAPFFEGRVEIKGLLSKLDAKDQRTKDTMVEKHIMTSYANFESYQNDSDGPTEIPTPILEVLTDKRQVV
tara:strand:- start:333 stop:683 length:351 start_codon:yes stop_codon:yes gene_type:complete